MTLAAVLARALCCALLLGQPTFSITCIADIKCDRVGNQTRADAANGQTIVSAYDPADRLVDRHVADARNRTVARFQYAYDPAGNTTREVTEGARDLGGPDDDVTHTYDPLNRLASSTDLTHRWTFSYDPAGSVIGLRPTWRVTTGR